MVEHLVGLAELGDLGVFTPVLDLVHEPQHDRSILLLA